MKKIIRTIKEILFAVGSFASIFFLLTIMTTIDIMEAFFLTTIIYTIVSLPVLIEMEEK